MKWKTMVVTAVIVLLVVALVLVGKNQLVSPEKRAALKRIKDYEIVAQEQRLITEILTLKMDAAVIQSKFAEARQRAEQVAPVQQVEIPELGPQAELPPDMR